MAKAGCRLIASSSVLVLSSLPVDPLNNADYFYAYQVKNGRYKLTARFEDKSFIEKMVLDGGLEPTLYEVGSDLRMPSPQSGLVLYLPFSEGTGTIAYDLSGYGNNGTLYSSTTICSNPPTSGCPQWVNGKVGKALSFDGVDDWVNKGAIGNNFVAISFWVYFPQNITSGSVCKQLFRYGSISDANNDQESIVIGDCSGVAFGETLMIMGGASGYDRNLY